MMYNYFNDNNCKINIFHANFANEQRFITITSGRVRNLVFLIYGTSFWVH